LKRFDEAFTGFDEYDRKLPGNPNVLFFKGYCKENAGNRAQAADLYIKYLQKVSQGDNAEYAHKRLLEWGYIKPTQT
jgi:tetratricopeptide (TPR) repeat protein